MTNKLPKAAVAVAILAALAPTQVGAYADTCEYVPSPPGLAPAAKEATIPPAWVNPGAMTGPNPDCAGSGTGNGFDTAAGGATVPACTGPNVALPGEWCDDQFPNGTPPGVLPDTCTAYPDPMASLTAANLRTLRAGWDVAGPPAGWPPPAPMWPPPGWVGDASFQPYMWAGEPIGAPDGNLDDWDLVAPLSGVAMGAPGTGPGTFSALIYPPVWIEEHTMPPGWAGGPGFPTGVWPDAQLIAYPIVSVGSGILPPSMADIGVGCA